MPKRDSDTDHDILLRVEAHTEALYVAMFGADETPEKGLVRRFEAVEREHGDRKEAKFPTCNPEVVVALRRSSRNGWHIAGLWAVVVAYGGVFYMFAAQFMGLYAEVHQIAKDVAKLVGK